MLTYFILAFLLALLAFWIRATPPHETLYHCLQDGKESALYRKRIRNVEFWGSCGPVRFPIGFTVEEYRRITCVPGHAYTKSTSDWFKPTWSERDKTFVDSYVALSREEGLKAWSEQIRVTRKVARMLRAAKNPYQGCMAT